VQKQLEDLILNSSLKNDTTTISEEISQKAIFHTWWPLAVSWLFMGLELPALSAIVARLENPEINLAAYGGIVFPLALIIESPIVMLLAASTALSKDFPSYRKIWKFMMIVSGILTALHLLVAITPLYYRITMDIIGAPDEIIEPARLGLVIMLPWTWAIAYRRFNQGVLIRFGHSQAVGIGTAVRLLSNLSVLIVGFLLKTIPGIAVATSAVAVGVTAEAVFVGFRIRPVLRTELRYAKIIDPPLTYPAFLNFYIPLVMTSLLTFIVQPIGSAAISRMPQPLDSLAVWPVITGLVFLMRGMGIAYNEVVISLIGQNNSYRNLQKFTWLLASASTILILLLTATSLSELWFSSFSGLSPGLTRLAQNGLWFALLMPALSVFQSWYQGAILDYGKTRPITEAVIIFICTISVLLFVGVIWRRMPGLYIALFAYGVGMATQTFWLLLRSRPAFHEVRLRDSV
jgi:hypothetical protein